MPEKAGKPEATGSTDGMIYRNSWSAQLCTLKGAMQFVADTYEQATIEPKGSTVQVPTGSGRFEIRRAEQGIVVDACIALIAPLSEDAALIALQMSTPHQRTNRPATTSPPPLEWYRENGRMDKSWVELLREIVDDTRGLCLSTLHIESRTLSKDVAEILEAYLKHLENLREKLNQAIVSA